MFNILI